MQAKKVFESMAPYTPGKQIEDVKKEYGLTKIVKLASNENPFGYSSKVKEAIPEMLDHLEIYPDGNATMLREKLSSHLNVSADQLIFGCGSDEIVEIISRTYLEEGTNTITAWPTFPQYRHCAKIEGAEVKEVPLLENGEHDLTKMLSEVDENTRIIWLCSPNNPTGNLIERDKLVSFLKKCPKDILVVVDEAYYEYIDKDKNPNTVELLNQFSNLIILRTFSKAYGLANLRVGYGIASKEIATLLNITRGPFNTTTIGQLSAIHALEDQDFIAHSYEKNLENKSSFRRDLEEIGLSSYESEANFLFVKLPTSGDQLFEYLLSKGFIVRSGEALGHPNGVRITIGTEEQMSELRELIKEYLITNNVLSS